MPWPLVIILLLFFLSWCLAWILNRNSPTQAETEKSTPLVELPWKRLYAEAEHVVAEIVERMPPELKSEATRVQCIFRQWAPADRPALGVYMSFEPGVVSAAPGPIILYLGDILLQCERYSLNFQEQVRKTYLHELGHHFGLTETDLKERGLG